MTKLNLKKYIYCISAVAAIAAVPLTTSGIIVQNAAQAQVLKRVSTHPLSV